MYNIYAYQKRQKEIETTKKQKEIERKVDKIRQSSYNILI
jgi:hypothetical protein